MGVYEEKVLPWFIDKACGSADLVPERRAVTAGLQGTVVEIGFGTGHNLPYYPASVDRILAVEPAARAVELAAGRIAASSIPVEIVGLDGGSLSLDDGSVDAVLSTYTLCTIPDVEAALGEVARVLRPEGQLHFLEHGEAVSVSARRWQRRIEPVWKRVAGGCHLSRRIPVLIQRAGFDASWERAVKRGPEPWTTTYWGTAVRTRS